MHGADDEVGNYLAFGVGNYLTPPLGNCLTLEGLRVGNYLAFDSPEPSSHRSPNWIALHNRAYNQGCADCHSTADAGGTSNTSFCSNSACHGIDFTFAGFNAPALRLALQGEISSTPSTPQVPSSSGKPTWDSYFGSLFSSTCGQCHGTNPQAGLVLTSYASAMKGSKDGPVIVPGSAAKSLVVALQRSGHFAEFTPQQLQAVVDWIQAGAAEK